MSPQDTSMMAMGRADVTPRELMVRAGAAWSHGATIPLACFQIAKTEGTAMTFAELYALEVMDDEGQPTGKLVLPIEHNDHNDQGTIVYQSLEAAEMAAKCTYEKYDVACAPVRISTINAD